jgi:hypothetical protein
MLEAMDALVTALLLPEVLIGTLLGLVAAAIVHWLAPAPEPLILEAGLVGLGFLGGFVFGWASDRKRQQQERG